jgi:FlaA1/EpsC-like NDP-sugar epimerase
LGSQGSVIPLFKKQIAEGGPITVTHPHMVRYFMTVQEAVQLILCAGTLANGGETFVLDMGSPRNILELAREMILLAGLEPERDIATVITGLRPGEKLSEELVAPSERLLSTRFEKLSVIVPEYCDTAFLLLNISRLVQCARDNDDTAIYDLLYNMGLGYNAPAARAKAVAIAAGQ